MTTKSKPCRGRERWRCTFRKRRLPCCPLSVQSILAVCAVTFTVLLLENSSGGTIGSVAFAEAEKEDRPPFSKFPDYLDENSVVLITGAAGFIGSELAMALHRTYSVRKLLCIDSMDSGFGIAALQASAASVRTEAEWKEKVEAADTLKSRTEEELALFEFKRQRAFHLLQTVGTKAHFYRADFRPSIPEFFDMGEVPLLDMIFRTHPDITHVVHLADPYHGAQYDRTSRGQTLTQAVPRVKEQTKSGMIEAIFEQLKKVGDETGKLPHFTYASSYEVYNHLTTYENNPNTPPFREDKPITVPSSLRGASKLIDEILASSYSSQHGIYSVGLRFFPVYGPWGLPGTSLFEMAERAVSDAETPILVPDADGINNIDDVRDYVYIDDAIDAIMAAMQFRPPGGEAIPIVINVGTGVGSSVKEVAKEMEKYFPREASARGNTNEDYGEATSTKKEPTVSYASTERATALLGFKAQVSLQEGLQKLLAWHYDRAFPYGGRPASGTEDETEQGSEEMEIDGPTFIAKSGIESCSPFDKECLHGAPVFPCASECSHVGQCIPSFYDEVLYMTRVLTYDCEAVLYTVALGGDLTVLPSATMAVSPNSIPHVGNAHDKNNHCNVAFVSEASSLVKRLKRELNIPSHVIIAKEFIRMTDSTQNDLSNVKLLKHGFWTLVPVADAATLTSPSLSYSADDEYILRLLPKLSPGLFFGERTKHAIYCDPNVLFSDVTDLLREAHMQPYKEGTEGATAMLVAGPREGIDNTKTFFNKYQTASRSTAGHDSTKRRFTKSIYEREALQQRAYTMVRVGMLGDMTGGGNVPIIDSSWIVHLLNVEDSRLFRCDVLGEIVQWDVGSDQHAMEFIMGLHDIWSRVIVQWGDDEPWWVGDAVIAVPQVDITGDETEEGDTTTWRNRRLAEDSAALMDKSDEEKITGENQEDDDDDESDSEGEVDGEGEEAEAFDHAQDAEEDKKMSDKWTGVLSSGTTRFFVRIIPAKKAGVIYFDEYSG